jgi:hypothetical protein
MQSNKSLVYALATTFLALGEAVGERALQRAGDLIREVLAEDVLDRETAEILEHVLVGIDYSPPALFADDVFAALADATAH